MNKFYTDLNAAANGKYKDLRFPRVEFGPKTARVTVVCKPKDRAFVAQNRAELNGLICDICGFNATVETVVDDSVPTESSVRAAVVEFTQKFSYISSILHSITVNADNGLTVGLKMHRSMYELAKNDYLPRLDEFLKNNFVDEINLDVKCVEFEQSGSAYAPVPTETKEYPLKNVTPIIGGESAPDKALSVMSISATQYNVAVCGVFAMPTVFTSKGGNRYEKFVLYDGEFSVQCRLSLSGGMPPIGDEYIGKTLCVIGNAEYDTYRNEANISVREAYVCDCGISAVMPRKAPVKYERVMPVLYTEYVQSSMFDGGTALPESLEGEFVVFDFETTGLSLLYDRPTELGAVKIKDGQITECFSTFIDPRKEIPPEVVEKTGITNEMVKGQPLFEDIIPDFYKFTENCGLVCHNIAFDFPILIKGGNRCGYAFGNRKTFDTMAIAPLALPGIQKLSLDKILEGLQLVNDNAHRALSDAAATAKAFIAMNKKLSN